MTDLNPNAVSGLASNLNTKEVIGKFLAVEKRRAEPIERRKAEKQLELESWNTIKAELEKLQEVSQTLQESDIWAAKEVSSSHPDIISAKALRQATPGKTTIVVDSVALAHQITSQGFAERNDNIGTGTVRVAVGDDEEERPPITVTLNDSNNTLDGLKNAINDADGDIEASIVKTGLSEKPYQLLLTSKVKGEQGRISIEVDLTGGIVDAPKYENDFDRTAQWQGVETEIPDSVAQGVLSSTPITSLTGNYTGEEDLEIIFKVVRPGVVNSEKGIVLAWSDNLGRKGSFEINKFNYPPGKPIPFGDEGLELRLSDGEVVAGDTFSAKAFAKKSDVLWWLSEDEKTAKIVQPSDWSTKESEGSIKVTGRYDGEENQTIVFRVEGSGQVGGQSPLYLHYEFSETGEKGKIDISAPYQQKTGGGGQSGATAFDAESGEELFNLEFGTQRGRSNKISIGQGLEIEVPPTVLNDGDTAVVEVITATPSSFWWLPEEERGTDGTTNIEAKWQSYAELEDVDEDELPKKAQIEDGLLESTVEQSDAPITIGGAYFGDRSKTYTFTATKQGTVGITRKLEVEWKDDQDNTGSIDFGEGYIPGTPVSFDSGLTISLEKGMLYEKDQFTIDANTATVQQPQDAVLRLGASELGGGVEIRRTENKFSDVIQGVELELFGTSKKPITITVTENTGNAKESINDFVDAFNTLSATVRELTKYDTQSNIAGPLLSDRNLADLYNEVSNTTISTVAGLPTSDNMLFAIGLRLNEKGLMSLDEMKLNEKMEEDASKVANVFKTNGTSDHSKVRFLGLTDNTKASPDGFQVDVLETATKGYLLGGRVPPQITVNETNNQLRVKVNGRLSDDLQLREGRFTLGEIARDIQSKLANDEKVGRRKVEVVEENGRLKFTSATFGSRSEIGIEASQENSNLALFGLSSEDQIFSQSGKDVRATIDGNPTEGRGQLVVGAEGTKADGLRVFVTMDNTELKEGVDATVKLTKGVASKLDELLQEYNDQSTGKVKQYTNDISQQMNNYDDQIKRINKRIEEKQQSLQIKFAKLESTMGRLKAQQNYVGQQLANLGG